MIRRPCIFSNFISFVIVAVPVELLILEAARIQFIVRAADLLLQNSSQFLMCVCVLDFRRKKTNAAAVANWNYSSCQQIAFSRQLVNISFVGGVENKGLAEYITMRTTRKNCLKTITKCWQRRLLAKANRSHFRWKRTNAAAFANQNYSSCYQIAVTSQLINVSFVSGVENKGLAEF